MYKRQGVGSLKAKDMIVSDVVVEQNGVGSVSCYASGTINISAQGVGSVNSVSYTHLERNARCLIRMLSPLERIYNFYFG